MSTFKGTSGPWEANYVQSAGWSVRRKFERPGYKGLAPICSLAWFQFDIPGIIDNEISGANATLIALSPELLESLQGLIADIEMEPNSEYGFPHLRMAMDVVARANTPPPADNQAKGE